MGRRRRTRHAANGPELTSVIHRLSGPQLAEQYEVFVEPSPTSAEWNLHRFPLGLHLATEPNAEHESSAAERVDSGDLLGDGGRLSQRKQKNPSAQRDAAGRRRHRREQRQRVWVRTVAEQVVPCEHRVETKFLGLLRSLDVKSAVRFF